MTDRQGMLYDHAGKRSNSRVVAFLCSVALCAIGIGVAALGWNEPSSNLLYLLAGGMLGPIGFNRFFGEAIAQGSAKGE